MEKIEDHEQFNLEEATLPNENQNDDWISADNFVKTNKNLSIKDFYLFGEQEWINKRGQKFRRTAVSGANYSAAIQDFLMGVTSVAVAPAIGLPKPSMALEGKHYIVKDESGGALTTNITIQSEGEATIDGASTSTIITNYGSKQFYTDSINWFTF